MRKGGGQRKPRKKTRGMRREKHDLSRSKPVLSLYYSEINVNESDVLTLFHRIRNIVRLTDQ